MYIQLWSCSKYGVIRCNGCPLCTYSGGRGSKGRRAQSFDETLTLNRSSAKATIALSFITWWMFTAWLLTKVDSGLGHRKQTLTQPYFKLHIPSIYGHRVHTFNDSNECPCDCVPLAQLAPVSDDGHVLRIHNSVRYSTISHAPWPYIGVFADCESVIICLALSFEADALSRGRSFNKYIHGVLNTLALIGISAGLYIILDCHITLNPEHPGLMNKIHSVCGWICFALFWFDYLLAAWLYGVGVGSDETKQMAMAYHKRIGILTLFSGYTSILLGLVETIDLHDMRVGQLMAGFVILTMGGVICSVIKFSDKKKRIAQYQPTDIEDPDDQRTDYQDIEIVYTSWWEETSGLECGQKVEMTAIDGLWIMYTKY